MNQKVNNGTEQRYRGLVIKDSEGKITVIDGDGESEYPTVSAAKQAIDQRISNQGGDAMSVKVQLKNTGKFINTDEEGATAIAAESDASTAKESEASTGSGKKLEELMKEVEDLNGQIAELQATAEEGKGELSVYKEKLDELLSDEAAEGQAEGMISESADADEIIENSGCTDKEKEEIRNSLGRIGNSNIYKLRGVALQTAVLNAIGFKSENMTPGEIKGAFKTHLQFANKGHQTTAAAKTVTGAKVFQNKGTETDSRQSIINKMWGKK